MKSLSWFTPPVGPFNGYGYAASETIQALNRQGIKVMWNDETCNVHINFIQPPMYGDNPLQYNIGYTPWESSEVPYNWVEAINKQKDFWTTSHYCKEVFELAGVQHDIKVVPHGIDPEVFYISERFKSSPFVFLHIGGPTERKGAQRVVDAFLECFGDNDDVYLVVKCNHHTEARWYDKDGHWRGSVDTHPRIKVISYQIDVDDLANLYRNVHCLVYPSNGEGFGLIPFQGMATGVPTILTDATGMKDFAHYGIPLKSRETPGEGVHLGTWAEPDQQHLCELMTDVYENYSTYSHRAIQSARQIHETQTWDHIAKQIIDLVGEDRMFEFEDKHMKLISERVIK